MYLSNEAKAKLKELAHKERRNPSQELLVLIEFYETYSKTLNEDKAFATEPK